ncbi:MAG: phosphoribosylaminoimidazole carboxylase [Actinomycetia bacterium]|nr:phosphoribosylaminoimidazole carboxylase [Actinomycetes bacterium]
MPIVGMVGGGQLARMTQQAAIGLGVTLRVLSESADDSAARACADVRIGDPDTLDDLQSFAKGVDVVTFDHEQVPGPVIKALEAAGVTCRPGSAALLHAQDKRVMRERLSALGAPCPRFAVISSAAEVEAFAGQTGWPVVLKATRGGYDGKGVWVCGSPDEAATVVARAAAEGVGLLAEEHVAFRRELAALVARSPYGQGAAYPIVETVQRDGICHEVIAPAPGLDDELAVQAQRLALDIADQLGVVGLLAVELFETSAGGILVNELAMRPHNSGHWTIEGARTSQFEQHLRAVLDLPLGTTTPTAPYVVMANVLGGTDPDVYSRYIHVMAHDPAIKVHFYGKGVRPGRKIGHVTALGDDLDEVRERARHAADYLRWGPSPS